MKRAALLLCALAGSLVGQEPAHKYTRAEMEQFLLNAESARAIINAQLATIRSNFPRTCDEADLSEVDRTLLWGRQFLHPFALQGWDEA